MKIRPFAVADEEAVTALWITCDLVRPWNDPVKDIRRKLGVDPERFLVGEVDGKIVGSLMAGYDGHRGWLNYLAVDPAFRRRGYGRRLVNAAENLLRAAGCLKINLQIRAEHRDVIAFYQSLGFAVDEVASMGKRLEQDG